LKASGETAGLFLKKELVFQALKNFSILMTVSGVIIRVPKKKNTYAIECCRFEYA